MSDDRERHARFLCRMWDDPDWIALSPRGQWFFMLLYSQAALNRAGVTALTSKRWKRLASGPAVEQQIALAMKELEDANFLVVDPDTEELLVRSYMRNDGIAKQPNMLKLACRQAREVLSPLLRSALEAELRRLDPPAGESVAAKTAAVALDAAIEVLGKGSGNPSPDPSRKGSDGRNGAARPLPAKTSKLEPLAEPFAEPRGVGEGVSSSSHLGNSSSSSSRRKAASRLSDPPRDDVDKLCSTLLARLHANDVKAAIGKRWLTEARLLLDRDRRPLDEALRLILWATSDPFWKGNIHSMPTFRAQYDKLRLQSQRSLSRTNDTDSNIVALMGGGQPNLLALPGGVS